jgi:hypothetical protein
MDGGCAASAHGSIGEMMDQFEKMKARNQAAFDAGKHARGEDNTRSP